MRPDGRRLDQPMTSSAAETAAIPGGCSSPREAGRRNGFYYVTSRTMPNRTCAYCGGPIPSHVRGDARYCGPSHRAMASQKRIRSARRKKPASTEKALPRGQGAQEDRGASQELIPLQARLLPPSFLEAEPWLWLELLLRTSAPPRAASYTVSAFPRDPAMALPAERYAIQPFTAPKHKVPGLIEVHFYAASGEPLTTVSRLVLELGPPR